MTNKIKSSIMKKIEKETPKSNIYFKIKEMIIGLAVALIFIFATYLFALFLYDYNILRKIGEHKDFLPMNLMRETFLELLIFVILAALGLFYLYRKTDWLGSKHQFGIIGASLVLIIFSGSLMYNASGEHKKEIFGRERSGLEQLGHKYRNDRLSKELSKKGVIIGKIKEINVNNKTIKIETYKMIKQITYTDLTDIQVGDFVRIKIQPSKKGPSIKEIKKIYKR